MKLWPIKNFALLSFGLLLGVSCAVGLRAAQEYRAMTGYAFWSKADENTKVAYMIGYFDAEQAYRLVLDKTGKSMCTDEGKQWIEDFDRKIPMPTKMTIKQMIDGIDDFYKDWKNQGVPLFLAQNIIRLQVVGRPQAEIEEAIRKARQAGSSK